MIYKAQSEKEHLAGKEFDSLPETMIKPFDRRYVAARGLVQLMQDNEVLPKNMSDARLSRVAQWIAAGMKASVRDADQQGIDYVSV